MNNVDANTNTLILSNNKENTKQCIQALAALGLKKIKLMNNGIEAFEKLTEEDFDLIVCDMDIKFINGWLYIQEMKNSDSIPNKPTLLFGKEEPPAADALLREYGIVSYLKSPFSTSALTNLINSTFQLFNTSGTIEKKYTEAKQALIENRLNEAIDTYSELRSMTKNSVRSSVGLSESYMKNEQHDKAAEVIESLPEDALNSPSQIAFQSKVSMKNKNMEKAVNQAKRLLEFDNPNIPYYYEGCAHNFFTDKHFEETVDICEEALSRSFEIPSFYTMMSKSLFAIKKFDKVLENVQQTIEKFGDSTESQNILGVCYKKMGDYESAIHSYERAIEISPLNAKSYFNLAMCLISMKRFDEAYSSLESCINIAPEFPKAKEKLAEIKGYMEKAS